MRSKVTVAILVVSTVGCGYGGDEFPEITVPKEAPAKCHEPLRDAPCESAPAPETSSWAPPEGAEGWTWPTPDQFEARWDAFGVGASPYHLVEAQVWTVDPEKNAALLRALKREHPELQDVERAKKGRPAGDTVIAGLHAAGKDSDYVQFGWPDASAEVDFDYAVGWEDPSVTYVGPPGEEQVVVWGDRGAAVLQPVHVALPPKFHPVWGDRVYTDTLLSFEPWPRAEKPMGAGEARAFVKTWERTFRGGPRGLRKNVTNLLTSGSDSLDFEGAVKHLREGGMEDHAIAKLYAHYQPLGRCSMDTRPQAAAMAHADLCTDMKQLGCALQLRATVMGNRFDRVAWSSYGEAAAPTSGAAIAQLPIDAARFFVGLSMIYARDDAPRAAGGMWSTRIAKAVRDASLTDPVAARLRGLAQDDSLDEVNRLRATTVLFGLGRVAERPVAEVRAELLSLQLSPVSRRWVERIPVD